MLPLANHLSKAFVVANDYELEIFLALSVFPDPGECNDIIRSNVESHGLKMCNNIMRKDGVNTTIMIPAFRWLDFDLRGITRTHVSSS